MRHAWPGFGARNKNNKKLRGKEAKKRGRDTIRRLSYCVQVLVYNLDAEILVFQGSLKIREPASFPITR